VLVSGVKRSPKLIGRGEEGEGVEEERRGWREEPDAVPPTDAADPARRKKA
jgi:hypothetical protein